MDKLVGHPMILLAGEQAAPNLLPVRHFSPCAVYIPHTSLPTVVSLISGADWHNGGSRCISSSKMNVGGHHDDRTDHFGTD